MQLAILTVDESVTRVQRALEVARRIHAAAHEAAVFLVASEAMTDALPNVPVKDGDLRDSRYVARSSPIDAGFGAKHAAKVHETHPTNRKFWQLAFSRSTSTMNQRIEQLMPRLIAERATLQSVAAVHPEAPPGHAPRRQMNRRRLAGRRRS